MTSWWPSRRWSSRRTTRSWWPLSPRGSVPGACVCPRPRLSPPWKEGVWLKYCVASSGRAMGVTEQATEAVSPHHVPRGTTHCPLRRDESVVETLMIALGMRMGEIRPVIGAVDETFLQRMMLVFMDLATGYLLLEEVAADRSFDTWFDRANERLTTFGTEVLYLVSDRAKALIKLAHTGLRCPSISDLFHMGHDLAKSYSLCIFGRLRHAKRDLEHAKQGLEKLQKNTQADPVQIVQTQSRVAACATSVHHWQEVGSTWRQHLSNVSRILHPWRLVDSIRQTSQAVEKQLG